MLLELELELEELELDELELELLDEELELLEELLELEAPLPCGCEPPQLARMSSALKGTRILCFITLSVIDKDAALIIHEIFFIVFALVIFMAYPNDI